MSFADLTIVEQKLKSMRDKQVIVFILEKSTRNTNNSNSILKSRREGKTIRIFIGTLTLMLFHVEYDLPHNFSNSNRKK